jgi:prepilin signal peptidase PulO-like enzyme (type II secretory pathway)
MGGAGWAAAAGMAAAGLGAGSGVMLLSRRVVPGEDAWLPAGLVSAATFAALWLRFGASPLVPALCCLAAAGVPLAFIDGRHKRLPDLLTLPAYPAALLLLGVAAPFTASGGRRLVYGLIGMAAVWMFFVLQRFVYPAGIGWGDVKLSGVIGLYLGWFGAAAVLAGIIAGYLLAAVTGVGLIVARRATRKSQIPFGPFMIAGALAVLLTAGLGSHVPPGPTALLNVPCHLGG